MSIDEAKHLALTSATRSGQRYYVVRLGDECQALTRDDIESHGLAMAQSPSPVLGYFDSAAITLDNFVRLN
jgi:hypothetical protein